MRHVRRPWLAALLLALPGAVRAEDVQMWHWWTNEVDLSRRFSLVLHGQFRTVRPLGEFLQGRTGPILRFYVLRKTALVGGYFYRREPNRLSPGWGDSHRYFAGIENYKFIDGTGGLAPVLLETRFLTERFQGGPAGTLTNYTRLRYRNRLSFREWKVSPLLGYEVFTFADSFWGQRPHAGIRWRANPKVMVDVGYYWDGRAPRAGAQRHLLFTNLLIRFKRTPDPDFPNRPAF
jgi:hypothetical protein